MDYSLGIINKVRKPIFLLFKLGVFTAIIIVAVNLLILWKTSNYIYTDMAELPESQAIIVLGAYVRGDNLSLVLEDRVKDGINLYTNGISNKILLSGDHGKVNYDEVNGMRGYVLDNSDISEEDIFLDHAGFDTYDSMYRAIEIFGIESAVIVTQEFHIQRAVYIARELGIDAVGYSVNQEKYKRILQFKWFLREALSRVKAFIDVISNSKPKYLGEMIPIDGDGRLSWDEFD